MFGDKYEYLRLTPFVAKTIQHAEEYIKKGEKEEGMRRIFKGVGYDRFEIKQIQDLMQLLVEKVIKLNNTSQTQDVLLRFLYANHFDYQKIIENIARHLLWLNKQDNYSLDQEVILFIGTGICYLSGRDKQYRPTLVINAHKINPEIHTPQFLTQVLSVLCIVMEDYYFYEGKVENWNILIETQERCLVDFPIDRIKAIITTMTINFPQTVDKIYILNASLSLQLSWNILEGFIPKETKKKIQLLKNRDLSQLKKVYDLDQLEKKFGGKMDDITKYWPPYNTLPEGQQFVEDIKKDDDVDENGQPNNFFDPEEEEKANKLLAQKAPPFEYSTYPLYNNHDFVLLNRDLAIEKQEVKPYSHVDKFKRATLKNQLHKMQEDQKQYSKYFEQEQEQEQEQTQTQQPIYQSQTVHSQQFGNPTIQNQSQIIRETIKVRTTNQPLPVFGRATQQQQQQTQEPELDNNYSACHIF